MLVRVTAVAGLALSTWLLSVVVAHAGAEAYDFPQWEVVLGVTASLVAVVGWLTIARLGDGGALAMAVVGAVLLGSIVVLPIVGVLGTVFSLVYLASRTQQGTLTRAKVVAGVLVALGLPVSAFVASAPRTPDQTTAQQDGSRSTLRQPSARVSNVR